MKKDVDVYYNINKECLSIKSRGGSDKGKVITHCHAVVVESPRYIVQPAGNKRVRKEKRKNVHAFVRGYMHGFTKKFNEENMKVLDFFNSIKAQRVYAVTYDPYKNIAFALRHNGKAIQESRWALIYDKLIYAIF